MGQSKLKLNATTRNKMKADFEVRKKVQVAAPKYLITKGTLNLGKNKAKRAKKAGAN